MIQVQLILDVSERDIIVNVEHSVHCLFTSSYDEEASLHLHILTYPALAPVQAGRSNNFAFLC